MAEFVSGIHTLWEAILTVMYQSISNEFKSIRRSIKNNVVVYNNSNLYNINTETKN